MRTPSRRALRWLLPAVSLLVVIAVVVTLVLVGRHREPVAGSPPPGSPSVPASTPHPGPPSATAPPEQQPGAGSTGAPPPTTAEPPGVPAGLAGRDLTVVPTSRRVVALTFDAGANAAGLPSILRTLAANGVHATFFVTGQWASADPGSVATIRAGGHRVGNHSATHPEFTALTDAQIRSEVLSAQSAITAAGADPRPFFRFPFGARDARTIADVNALGYVAVRWTVDTLGWEGTAGGMSAQRVADRAVAALQPGEIVLMHVGSNPDDGTTFDADALPGTIARMRAAGYQFVTLDALLGS